MAGSTTICASHPFLTFTVDVRRFTPRTWMLLGEAVSKIAHVASSPLSPEVARRLHEVALIRGVRATTAIEGNTLSEDEVRGVLHGTLTLPPSRDYLLVEVQNVLHACNEVLEALRRGDAAGPPIDVAWLCRMNTRILNGLTLEEGVVAGSVRRHRVVGRHPAPGPEHLDALLRALVSWLDELAADAAAPGGFGRGAHIVRAVLAHLYLAWIHPFGDGNGRTSRLLELAILLQSGVPTCAAHLLANHYNLTRTEYYRELDRASSTGDPYGFLEYSLQGLVDGLADQIGTIQREQLHVAWKDHVWNEMEPATEAQKRQFHLAVRLARHGEPVRRRDLLGVPDVARLYISAGPRTLARDLNALLRRQLVTNAGGWIRARTERVESMKPFAADLVWGTVRRRQPSTPARGRRS